jgi:predicted RNA-binding protein
MDEEQQKQFVTALVSAIVGQLSVSLTAFQDQTLSHILENTVLPMRQDMTGMANHLHQVSALLRQNRRDINAREAMKVLLVSNHMDDPKTLAAMAYATAEAMEVHAIASEVQHDYHMKRMIATAAETLAKNPKADPATLARAFLNGNALDKG